MTGKYSYADKRADWICNVGCECECCRKLIEFVEDVDGELKSREYDLDDAEQRANSLEDEVESLERKLREGNDKEVAARMRRLESDLRDSRDLYTTNQEKLRTKTAEAERLSTELNTADQTILLKTKHYDELKASAEVMVVDLAKKHNEEMADLVRVIKILRKGNCNTAAPCDRIEDGVSGGYVCTYHDYED